MMNIKPQLTLLKAQTSYRGDPTTIFHQLCGARPATLLLESAEINSKQNLQSLLVIDSALRITALGRTVSVQALTANGAALLPLLDEALPPEVRNQARPNGRELTFPTIDAVQDEDARLRSLSVFDALRTLLTLVDSPADEREAVMLGGLFAYDLVAGFEDLPALRQDQRCPDFCFYLAETLLVLDHQRGTARLQASVFSEQASEAQRLQQRLEQLQAELQQTPQPIPHQTLENMQLSCNQSDEEYGAVVSELQEAIRQGEIFQVVPSRRFTLPCPAPLAAAARRSLMVRNRLVAAKRLILPCRIRQHQRVAARLMAKMVNNTLQLHEAADKIETALLILNTVIPHPIATGEFILYVHLIFAEQSMHRLRHRLPLEDAQIAIPLHRP